MYVCVWVGGTQPLLNTEACGILATGYFRMLGGKVAGSCTVSTGLQYS